MQVRPVTPYPIRLKGISLGSRVRDFLDGAELWQGVTLLGTVSGEWLATLVAEKLDQVAMLRWTEAELAADPNRPLGPLARKVPISIPPLKGLPPPKTVRAERRARRRQRRSTHR